jgi:hypothetical protein
VPVRTVTTICTSRILKSTSFARQRVTSRNPRCLISDTSIR